MIFVALGAVACGKDEARAPAAAPVRAPDAAAPAPRAVDAATPAPPPAVDAGGGRAGITLSITPDTPRGPGLAARCSLDGDPLGSDCSLDRGMVAVTPDGRVYVVDTAGVRRYTAATPAPDACALTLDRGFADGGVLAIPAMPPPPQRLEGGPVYMRSGGPSWSVVVAPTGAVYAFDFLLGIHRIDRGKVEPACPGLQGISAVVFAGTDAYVLRGGEVEALTIGKRCKTRPVALDPAPGRGLYVVDGALAGETDERVALYGKGRAARALLGDDDAFAPGGFCSALAVFACGGAACVLDHNCKKVPRYAADGAFVRTYAFDELFTDAPYVASTAVTAADGAVWIGASHKDGSVCEGAVYRLAPGVWDATDAAPVTSP